GDTLWPGCDPCASNSAGLGTRTGPTDELDAEFVPLTPVERVAWRSADDRVAIWPTGAITTGAGTAAVMYARYLVEGPLQYTALGWGIATAGVGQPAAMRALDLAGLPYGHPLRVGRRVYAFGCERQVWIAFACDVARAPVATMTDAGAWRYWSGKAWSSDPSGAAPVLSGPSGGLSVAWNKRLGAFLAVYNVGLTNRVVMRTAPSPIGPWSDPTTVFTGLDTPPGAFDYAAMEQHDLARDGGRVLTVTYFHPLGALAGEIRRVELTLP
ncbi:MAG TPA: DUF4185 domain-containing protein, partial [Actinomycetota bacterium]